MIDVDPRNPLPLYLQLIEQLRRQIVLGALRPGDRLPTVRELASRARINRNTAARAIRALEAEGLVWTRVGQGTFVADDAPETGSVAHRAALEAALDRLIDEAMSLGTDLAGLPEGLARRIEARERERGKKKAGGDGAGRRAAAGSEVAGEKEDSP
jgi:GntR family transcriptional regulator